MALQKESERTADVGGWEDDEGRVFGNGPEEKYVYRMRVMYPTAANEVVGVVCTYAQQDLNGTDDYYGPPDYGRPVIGNFLAPKMFHWRLSIRQAVRVIESETYITNMMSFRLIFLLVWRFPKSLGAVLPDLGYLDYLQYFGVLENGRNVYFDWPWPDVKESCVLLYDCVHTIGSPTDFKRNTYGNVAAALGGQAGYVVGPADPGYVVPAANVPATTTVEASDPRTQYGGHHMFLDGEFDLSRYSAQAGLWRDPEGVDVAQIVPYVACFIGVGGDHFYSPASSFSVGNRPAPEALLSTRYSFTDQ